jgi:Tol biopolymer transport system component
MKANPSEVQAQLERILASSVFSTSARAAQFLRFCVEQSLQGKHDQIKESTVAVEVFGRTPDYDPRTDLIVRVYAKRLRDKLDDYYTAHGGHDPVRITMPKGSYVPQAVRTLPKRKVDFSDWPKDAREQPHVSEAEDFRRRNLVWLIGVAVGLGALILTVAIARRNSVSAVPLRVAGEALPLNALPGIERTPSWSPDGGLLAYSWDGGARHSPEIYLEKTDQSQPFRLTHSRDPEYRPVWSPDGRSLTFIRYLDSGHFEVVRAIYPGGVEEKVGIFTYFWPNFENPPALDWSPDGKSLLIAEQSSALSPVHLLLFTLSTGERRPLTNPGSGTNGDIEGKFSPDGTLVAFQRGGFGDLYLVSIAGEVKSPVRKLTHDNPGVRGISWTRDGRRILFGTHQNGSSWGIWQVDTNGENLAPLLSGGFDATSPAVSPDRATIAVEHEERETNLTAIPLDKVEASAQLFVPSSRQDYNPAYSPDGKRVAFVSTRRGPMELWLANSDGSGVRQLTQIGGVGFPINPAWSPDGNKIVFALRNKGLTNIAESDLRNGTIKQLTSGSTRSYNPMYSSDGQYLYFISDSGGIDRIWRMPADGRGRGEQMYWDVAIAGTFQMSQDRKSIFFGEAGPELHLFERNLANGSLQSIFSSNRRLTSFEDLCVHGDTIFLILSSVGEPSQNDLVAVDIRSGHTKLLKTFNRVTSGLESGCSVSPDGRTLLLTKNQQDSSDIYLAKLKLK